MKDQLKKTAMAICASVLLSTGVAMADWTVLGNHHLGVASNGLNIVQFPGVALRQIPPTKPIPGGGNIDLYV